MRYGEIQVNGASLVAPNDVRTTVESEDRRRRSAFLGADWRISPDLRVDFDGLVSTFDNAHPGGQVDLPARPAYGRAGCGLRVKQGVVVAGRVSDGRIDNNTEFSDQSHLNVAASLGARLRTGDWTLSPRVSVSSAHSVLDTPLLRLSAQSPDGVAYDFDLGEAASTARPSG